MIMKYYINYNTNLRTFTIYVSGFEDGNDDEIFCRTPQDLLLACLNACC